MLRRTIATARLLLRDDSLEEGRSAIRRHVVFDIRDGVAEAEAYEARHGFLPSQWGTGIGDVYSIPVATGEYYHYGEYAASCGGSGLRAIAKSGEQ